MKSGFELRELESVVFVEAEVVLVEVEVEVEVEQVWIWIEEGVRRFSAKM